MPNKMTSLNSTLPSLRRGLSVPRQVILERRRQVELAQRHAARRKAAQRAKFILGGVVLANAQHDPALVEQLCTALPERDRRLVRSVVATPPDSPPTA